MTTSQFAKSQAKRLRAALAARNITLTHSDSLELVAQSHGFRDWNTLCGVWPAPLGPIPQGWFQSGDQQTLYDFGTAPGTTHKGHGVAAIRLKTGADGSNGFGTLMQTVKADAFHDARVRLSASLRLTSIAGAATLWLRADTASGQSVAFDNMESRAELGTLHGVTDWCDRSIVLDIPPTARTLSFGFYLRGDGVAHCAGMVFEAVDNGVPVSADTKNPHDRPVNLTFAQT